MPDATETPAPTRRRLDLPTGLALCLCGLLLYFLSPGPVAKIFWAQQTGRPSAAMSQFFEVVYFPLETLYRNSDAVRAFYDWYFKLWGIR